MTLSSAACLLADTTVTSTARILWGSPAWLGPIAIATLAMLALVAWGYLRRSQTPAVRMTAATLKVLGILAIALCIVEPLFSAVRPRPGANLFLVMADNSQSLTVRDDGSPTNRGEHLRAMLRDDTSWMARLGQDFELRRYLFDSRVRGTDSFQALTFDGSSSSLAAALTSTAGQYRGRPVAGILLLTDGNATDWNDAGIDWEDMPPVYPVIVGENRSPRDVNVSQVSVSQTNFESLPVTIQTVISCQHVAGEELVLQLLDESGQEIQRQSVTAPNDDKPLGHRFQFRPENPGVSFYQVRAVAKSEEHLLAKAEGGREATFANNTRLAMVDRGQGPYRVLYVGGRPNWDFKYLRRAVAEDPEVELVALLRIAKKEPRFSFRGHKGEAANPLYRGFPAQDDPTAEQHNEPVLVRLGTRDPAELRNGFPKASDQLFGFHAVILDDIEAEFFTHDQMSLLQEFVSQRGGGLLMLAGEESFGGGHWDRTPIGEMLPVYIDRMRPALAVGEYRLMLSRDGWLQPWVRLRPTEEEEGKRIDSMPGFRVWNAASNIKPGATVLIHGQGGRAQEGRTASEGARDAIHPALVVQRFGRGQSAALLVGDLWRWGLRREAGTPSDLEKSWRQTVRWLVSDVPHRVSVETKRDLPNRGQAVELRVSVRDENYQPLDNATVVCEVATPDGKTLELTAVPVDDRAGDYVADVVPRVPGAYRIAVKAHAADGNPVGTAATGLTHEPATDEFQALRPNRELLQRIADRTGGELIGSDNLDGFVSGMPNRKIPISEPWVYPLWHQWPMLGLAILCLVGEWGLRRWKGLP